jgi:hypothetical protein
MDYLLFALGVVDRMPHWEADSHNKASSEMGRRTGTRLHVCSRWGGQEAHAPALSIRWVALTAASPDIICSNCPVIPIAAAAQGADRQAAGGAAGQGAQGGGAGGGGAGAAAAQGGGPVTGAARGQGGPGGGGLTMQ